MKEVFEQAVKLIGSGQGFVYTAIINKDGSAPSDVGARMIVLKDRIVGTIGGGGVEADVIRFAREAASGDKGSFVRYYDLSSDDSSVAEFICGGTTQVLIRYIDPEDEKDREFFEKALEAVSEDKRAWIVYTVTGDKEPGSGAAAGESIGGSGSAAGTGRDGNRSSSVSVDARLAITLEDEGIFGSFEGSDEVKRDMAENPLRLSIHADSDKGCRYIIDRIGTCGNMLIMGGGHVSLEAAVLAKRLDFNVTIVDDRPEFANEERFPGCKTIAVDSFDEIPELKTGKGAYILIITRGHKGDLAALRWALTREAGYVGMIGSKKKRDIIYDRLRAEGIAEEKIRSVHSPIGLSIGAKTPAEIAVSIMAEVIKCRYET